MSDYILQINNQDYSQYVVSINYPTLSFESCEYFIQEPATSSIKIIRNDNTTSLINSILSANYYENGEYTESNGYDVQRFLNVPVELHKKSRIIITGFVLSDSVKLSKDFLSFTVMDKLSLVKNIADKKEITLSGQAGVSENLKTRTSECFNLINQVNSDVSVNVDDFDYFIASFDATFVANVPDILDQSYYQNYFYCHENTIFNNNISHFPDLYSPLIHEPGSMSWIYFTYFSDHESNYTLNPEFSGNDFTYPSNESFSCEKYLIIGTISNVFLKVTHGIYPSGVWYYTPQYWASVAQVDVYALEPTRIVKVKSLVGEKNLGQDQSKPNFTNWVNCQSNVQSSSDSRNRRFTIENSKIYYSNNITSSAVMFDTDNKDGLGEPYTKNYKLIDVIKLSLLLHNLGFFYDYTTSQYRLVSRHISLENIIELNDNEVENSITKERVYFSYKEFEILDILEETENIKSSLTNYFNNFFKQILYKANITAYTGKEINIKDCIKIREELFIVFSLRFEKGDKIKIGAYQIQ